MSTRAVFTFKDKLTTFHIYKHYDGYPLEALKAIEKAIRFSWELPRFEASDFAAAFVAANKNRGGNIYLCNTYKDCQDLDYWYEVYFDVVDNALKINAYSRIWDGDEDAKYILIFSGTLEEFKTFKE